MDFRFSEDQETLRRTARDYLREHSPLRAARAVLESEAPYDAGLWRGVAALGWPGTAVPEEYGGAGLGHLELAVVAEELGRALAPLPFASSVYLATEALLLGGTPAQRRRWLPVLASGDAIGTFADAGAATFRQGRVTGTKAPVPDGMAADLAVLTTDTGLALVDLAAPGVVREPLASIDPSRPQARLVFERAPAEPLDAGPELADRVRDRAAILVAFEQLGGAERALESTREYMLTRYAFGRPIASFQALKHRLVDVYAAIELARAHCWYAAWAVDAAPDAVPLAACGARVAATDAFELAAREMIQLHGGSGFTWELDCHLFYRRSKLLALALGGPSAWRERLVARLTAHSPEGGMRHELRRHG
jgi:alkylation response protein AidB-like acyl-CoA dehydrogenase